VSAIPHRYTSPDEDSARWTGFRFREDDIVISTRSKCGTTWVQMICALLIFQTPDLPQPLTTLSPWLDWSLEPRTDVYARLDGQRHRRFIKSHTPLDGLPSDPRVAYLVTGRHPLDMAVSLYHQGSNLDRERIRQLTGSTDDSRPTRQRPDLHQWLLEWIDDDPDPRQALDSLPGVLWHLSGAWHRRHQPNVVLIHYDDLVDDLDGQMRRLADRLEIDVPDDRWPGLVDAASFASMRSNAAQLAPNPAGILKDPVAFFRRGSSGAGHDALSHGELDRFHDRVEQLAPPELVTWLLRRDGAGSRGTVSR
jgi:hypothetical protein